MIVDDFSARLDSSDNGIVFVEIASKYLIKSNYKSINL